jgi:carbon-monoxide dehydrogenase medium subunit
MAVAHSFEYEKAESVADAVALLQRYGPGTRILAGGTDLVAWVREEVVTPPALIDIKAVPELDRIELSDGILTIGARVTFNELIESDITAAFPLVREMAHKVASSGIRNRATAAGNICSAVPCCDMGPVLLAYDGEVLASGPNGERTIPAREWFVGPRQTSLQPDELVTALRLRMPEVSHAGCWAKLSRCKGEDLAQASVAVLVLEGFQFRIAFGSVAPTPLRATTVESLLNGHAPEADLLAQAVDEARRLIAPITDIRASKEYRAEMICVMLERALQAAMLRLDGKGPAYGTSVI